MNNQSIISNLSSCPSGFEFSKELSKSKHKFSKSSTSTSLATLKIFSWLNDTLNVEIINNFPFLG